MVDRVQFSPETFGKWAFGFLFNFLFNFLFHIFPLPRKNFKIKFGLFFVSTHCSFFDLIVSIMPAFNFQHHMYEHILVLAHTLAHTNTIYIYSPWCCHSSFSANMTEIQRVRLNFCARPDKTRITFTQFHNAMKLCVTSKGTTTIFSEYSDVAWR